MTMWKEWVLDVTNGTEPPCFCPYERATDTIVVGMGMFRDKSPGDLVGVCHAGGKQAAADWIEAHPDWQCRYSEPAPNSVSDRSGTPQRGTSEEYSGERGAHSDEQTPNTNFSSTGITPKDR